MNQALGEACAGFLGERFWQSSAKLGSDAAQFCLTVSCADGYPAVVQLAVIYNDPMRFPAIAEGTTSRAVAFSVPHQSGRYVAMAQSSYRGYFIDGFNHVRAIVVIEAVDDEAACTQADTLLANSPYGAIEIWDGSRIVGRRTMPGWNKIIWRFANVSLKRS